MRTSQLKMNQSNINTTHSHTVEILKHELNTKQLTIDNLVNNLFNNGNTIKKPLRDDGCIVQKDSTHTLSAND